MAVTINITKNEHSFIDGSTGEELTPEQFNQRYSKSGMGGLSRILSSGRVEEESSEDKEL